MINLKYIILVLFAVSCTCTKETNQKVPFTSALAKVIIYKTNANYNTNVPIGLSENKQEIVSYPHQEDLQIGRDLLEPITLKNGYLLDRKGISTNTAFLKYTYLEYSKFKELPNLKELFDNIIEFDPILEIYECGYVSDYKNLVDELNEKIEKNQFDKFKKIK